MKIQSITRAGAVLAVASLALGLTACSGEQSVTDACKVTQSTMTEVQSSLTAMGTGDTDALKDVQKALEDAQGKVTNPDVSEKLKALTDEFNAFADEAGQLDLSDPTSIDPTDQDTMDLVESLNERVTKLQKAGTEFDSLCNAG